MRTRESGKGVRSIYLINGTGSKADRGNARENLGDTSRQVSYRPEELQWLCRDSRDVCECGDVLPSIDGILPLAFHHGFP